MGSNQQDHHSARLAMEALTRTTGLTTTLLEATDRHHDGVVQISADNAHSVQLPYEVKATVDRRDQLSSFKMRHGSAMLITRYLSAAMTEKCRELEIQFADHAGNCYLRQPGVFVFVTGCNSVTTGSAPDRGLTPAALRVVFAVLTLPPLLNNNVRHIAEVASISHGAAAAALVTLEHMGLFTSTKNGRVIASPERWLDAWTEGYLGRIRPKLEKYRMSATDQLAYTIERVVPQMREVAVGGEVAAARRELGLQPGALTLYVDLNDPTVMRSLMHELKLRRDPEGNIELISMFWNTLALPWSSTVPDALIYADLVGTGDQRSMETAMQLKIQICRHVATAA